MSDPAKSPKPRYHYTKLSKYENIEPHSTHIYSGGDSVFPGGTSGVTFCGKYGRLYDLVLPVTPELSSTEVCEACAAEYQNRTGIAHTPRPSQVLHTPK